MSLTLHKKASFSDVVAAFRKFLVIGDERTMRVMLAAYVARSFDTDPVWLFLVAASSGGKSEMIRSLTGLDGAHELSSLTPQTFLSGFKGANGTDPSLLAKIRPDTVFLLKDFTTILNLRADDKGIIMSQLREIYDGKIDKEFGTGVTRSWEGKVGFIAGCTYTIEESIMMNASYGDRFLYWKMPDVDVDDAMNKQFSVMGHEEELRNGMRDSVTDYVASLGDFKGKSLPQIPDDAKQALIKLCQLAVSCRGPVTWSYNGKDIVSVGQKEFPMRYYKQAIALGTGLMVLRDGDFDGEDWSILAKATLDSIPSWRLNAIRCLQKDRDSWKTTAEIGMELRLPTGTVRKHLSELESHGVIDRHDGGNGNAYQYRLSDDTVTKLSYETDTAPEEVERSNIIPVSLPSNDL